MFEKKYDATKDLLDNTDFFKTDCISGNIEPAMSFFKESRVYGFKKEIIQNRKNTDYNNNLLDKVNIKVNNFYHRSPDFHKLDSSNLNILFAGCSTTLGEGLPENHTWTDYVVSKLKENNIRLGATDNLSFSGGSLSKIIINIFRYIEKFGKPDYILMLTPDFFRENTYIKDEKQYNIKMVYDFINEKKSEDVDVLNIYDMFTEYKVYYEMLNIFCKINKIKLYATSWYEPIINKMNFLFSDSFMLIDYSKIYKYASSKDFDEEYFSKLDKDFSTSAADNLHPGTLYQMYIGDRFIKEILKND
jgi:hypothetical protein